MYALNVRASREFTKFQFISNFSIEIYNRWGLNVFSSDNYMTEWDGNINGEPVPEGVY
jgi:gliding motility-associated-like protein